MSYILDPVSSEVSGGDKIRAEHYNNLRTDALSGFFGGSGSDGALSISSGTTTIDASSSAVVVKNYTSISITGTGQLALSNPHDYGTVLVLRSQGDVTISSSEPAIELNEDGGEGGDSDADGKPGKGYMGSGGVGYTAFRSPDKVGGGGGNLTIGNVKTQRAGDTGGGSSDNYVFVSGGMGNALPPIKSILGIMPLPGGGGGTGLSNGAPSGYGGRGGGALLIECGGVLDFSGTIEAKGGDGTSIWGGDGAGGSIAILYKTLTANTGTITVTGGTNDNNASVGQTLVEENIGRY